MVALVGLHSSISQPRALARRGLSPNIPFGLHAFAVAVWAFGTLDRGGCDDLRRHIVTIVGIQLAGSGLPATRDATCMQVNAFVGLSGVMV